MNEPALERVRDGDLPAIARLVSHAFAGTLEASQEWIGFVGDENVRLLREGDVPVASLIRVPMGQYFGGRSVPMVGVAGVAVAPEARGRGLAGRLMSGALHELLDEGCPISCLYASTQTLYRKVGYEQAGYRCVVRIPLVAIDVRERGPLVTPLTPEDDDRVRECYTAFARVRDGWLDRGPYLWARARALRGESYHGFGVGPADRLDGYVYLTQRRKPETGRHDVVLSDVAFRTPEAGRRLLGFLADFATVGDDLVFHGGPHHPLLWLLGQQREQVTLRDYWMLRVTDPTRAVEARGFPAGVTAEVPLELHDRLLGVNGGRYLLHVADGRGSLERGGPGGVWLDERAFAALYSGFMSAAQLRQLGCLEGADEHVDALRAVFGGGGVPAMPDMF